MWEGLWRRTVTLAREYPALWLPVVIADLADFALRNAKAVVKPHLLLAVLRTHSAVGRVSANESAGRRMVAMFTGGGLELTVWFAMIAFYVVAFFLTVRMVQQRLGSLDVQQRHLAKRLSALSLRGLLVIVIVAVTSSLVWAFWASGKGYIPRVPWLLMDLWFLVAMSLISYVMVPAGLRAVAQPEITHVDRAVVRLGRTCAAAAVAASTSLMIVGKILERGFVYDGHGVALMIGAINSVVVALPYAPLYIALGVLADRVGPANAKADPLRG